MTKYKTKVLAALPASNEKEIVIFQSSIKKVSSNEVTSSKTSGIV